MLTGAGGARSADDHVTCVSVHPAVHQDGVPEAWLDPQIKAPPRPDPSRTTRQSQPPASGWSAFVRTLPPFVSPKARGVSASDARCTIGEWLRGTGSLSQARLKKPLDAASASVAALVATQCGRGQVAV